MEEVYGWTLEELDRKIIENKELVYYGYFPFAYLFYHSKIRGANKEIYDKKYNNKIREKKNKIYAEKRNILNRDEKGRKKLLKKIEKLNEDLNVLIHKKKKILDNLELEKARFRKDSLERIKPLKTEEFDGLIPEFKLRPPKDHRNFWLYQV